MYIRIIERWLKPATKYSVERTKDKGEFSMKPSPFMDNSQVTSCLTDSIFSIKDQNNKFKPGEHEYRSDSLIFYR